MAMQYNMEPDQIREALGDENLTYVKGDIKMRNAIQFMFDNAEIVEAPEEAAEDAAEEAAEDAE